MFNSCLDGFARSILTEAVCKYEAAWTGADEILIEPYAVVVTKIDDKRIEALKLDRDLMRTMMSNAKLKTELTDFFALTLKSTKAEACVLLTEAWLAAVPWSELKAIKEVNRKTVLLVHVYTREGERLYAQAMENGKREAKTTIAGLGTEHPILGGDMTF